MERGPAASRLGWLTSSTSNELFRLASHGETTKVARFSFFFFLRFIIATPASFFKAKLTDVPLLVSMYILHARDAALTGCAKKVALACCLLYLAQRAVGRLNGRTTRQTNMQHTCEVIVN